MRKATHQQVRWFCGSLDSSGVHSSKKNIIISVKLDAPRRKIAKERKMIKLFSGFSCRN